MNKITLLLVFLTITFNSHLTAQQRSSSERTLSAVNAYASLGYPKKSFESLNSYAINNDIPVFSDQGLSLGFGGNVFFKRFLYGGHGTIHLSNKSSGSSLSSKISSGSGFLNMGYIIYENAQSLVYPSLGLGIRGTSLEIKPNTPGQSETRDISSTNLLANLSVNADFFSKPPQL